MGKVLRWFCALFGLNNQRSQDKRRWKFVNSSKQISNQAITQNTVQDNNMNAIGTSNMNVVRLSSVTRLNGVKGYAAMKIQAAFRGYLARRALRALKGLVRLQALVRGYIVRKQFAQWLKQIQSLLRAQTRARIGRVQASMSPNTSCKSSLVNHLGPSSPANSEQTIQSRIGQYVEPSTLETIITKLRGRITDEQDKAYMSSSPADHKMTLSILEKQFPKMSTSLHSGKYDTLPRGNNVLHSAPQQAQGSDLKDSTTNRHIFTSYSAALRHLWPLKYSNEADESSSYATDNSLHVFSDSSRGGSSRRSPSLQTKSDCSDIPNYMAFTKSARAKIRSFSAPKQRPRLERSNSGRRYSIYSIVKPRTQKVASMHDNFIGKAYPGSGYLDGHGMPVRYEGVW